MESILITGGAGFIGSNVARSLMKWGYQVSIIDDLSMGTVLNVPPGARLLEGDVRAADPWRALTKIDAVLHVAGPSSTPLFSAELATSVGSSIVGFVSVLERARHLGARRIIYASSALVYGNGPTPFVEDASLDATNFYSLSKCCMEHFARLYSRQHDLDVVGLRFMSIYGPGEDHKGRMANLVSQFIWDVEADRDPVIYGDGGQSRDFTNVSDVAQAIRLLLESPKSHGCAVFNVGTGISTSLNSLILTLSEMMDASIEPRYVRAPPDYNWNQRASLERIEQALGYRPQIQLRQGIAEILALRRSADDMRGHALH